MDTNLSDYIFYIIHIVWPPGPMAPGPYGPQAL